MSIGAYKGLEEIAQFDEGDRVTILIETTIEEIRDLVVGEPGLAVGHGKAVEFGGGYTLEFPTEHDARATQTDITVRRKIR